MASYLSRSQYRVWQLALTLHILSWTVEQRATNAKSRSVSLAPRLVRQHLNSLLYGNGYGTAKLTGHKKIRPGRDPELVAITDTLAGSTRQRGDYYLHDEREDTETIQELNSPLLPECASSDWSCDDDDVFHTVTSHSTGTDTDSSIESRVCENKIKIPASEDLEDELSESSDGDYYSFPAATAPTPYRTIIYKYFGRTHTSSRYDSVPFILIGPDSSHWKKTGQALASRGFNVIAISQVNDDDDDEVDTGAAGAAAREGGELVTAVLNALRWKRAILVGCDEEAILAIDAALQMSPDRVAGLVLCGDITKTKGHVSDLRKFTAHESFSSYSNANKFSLDEFIWRNISCPSTIVWDGDKYGKMSKTLRKVTENFYGKDMRNDMRISIVGGGSSPHQRMPEHFATVLTRFVEEQVFLERDNIDDQHGMGNKLRDYFLQEYEDQSKLFSNDSQAGIKNGPLSRLRKQINNHFKKMLSPESLITSGRIAAAVLIYISFARTTIHQYHNVRIGITGVRNKGPLLQQYGRNIIHFAIHALVPSSRKHPRIPDHKGILSDHDTGSGFIPSNSAAKNSVIDHRLSEITEEKEKNVEYDDRDDQMQSFEQLEDGVGNHPPKNWYGLDSIAA